MPITRKMKAGPLERSITLQREAIDENARTVDVAFSSEEPVERWFGNEILDHSPTSIRLGRLQNGGAVLVGHDHRDHVGVVESVSIDSDRRGRAKVRLGTSPRADEIFNDVKDGIIRHISVGYRIHELERNEGSDDYRATDWEPFEISFVAVPADASVGIARADGGDKNEIIINERSAKKETNAIEKFAKAVVDDCVSIIQDDLKEKAMPEEQTKSKSPAVHTDSKELLKAERQRINKINDLGRKYQLVSEAETAINEGTSLADFRGVVLDKLNTDKRTEAKPVTQIDMTSQEVKRYSIMKALRAAESGDWSKAGLERDVSLAVADKLGKDARGFYIPYDVQQRDMTTGGAGTGAELVGTDHLGGSFIDALRDYTLLMNLGADVLTGLVGNVDIPGSDGDGTFYWLNEDEDATDSDIPTRTVSLTPKTVAGAVPVTRRLLKQSDPSVESMIMRQLQLGAAVAIDNAGFAGVAKGPKGILKTTGIGTVTLAKAGAPTWAEVVAFETAIASDNALAGNMAYVAHSGVIGHCKSTPRDAGSGLMLMEGGTINGYAAHRKNGIAATDILFGNFADVAIGMWGVLDVMPDKATKAASGGLVMRVFQDLDIVVKQPKSFAKAVTA
ncbi:phage major capsid protein [Endozoicomonas sp. Mp262]|uniref:phage major capsid protein n=1 Tax=Endozoicomonas sp. Mp262 TaxID=2919499 RepID=UPI0021D8724D